MKHEPDACEDFSFSKVDHCTVYLVILAEVSADVFAERHFGFIEEDFHRPADLQVVHCFGISDDNGGKSDIADINANKRQVSRRRQRLNDSTKHIHANAPRKRRL